MPDPDLSEFVTLSKPRRVECTVKAALGRLTDVPREQLRAALAASHITNAAISAWLKERDVRIQPGTIARHRKGACSCDD